MIVYTPIDLPCRIPDRKTLTDYVIDNHMTNLTYTSMLCAVASRNPVSDWRDSRQVFPDNDQGYDLRENPEIYYAPGFEEMFPELVDFIKLLPFQQLLGIALNMHTNILYAHQDDKDRTGVISPERYNVLLTPHYNQDSFFISKTKNSERIYPKIPERAPVYAFNNKDIFHGADKILDQRIIMVCAGIIDQEKHQDLINRSAEKFKDYVIRFEDL